MNLSSYIMSIVRLAADDPDMAERELRQTMSQWSREGYHVQHNDALWAAVQIELYRGNGMAAWGLIDRSWPALRRSLLLRVQFIRTSMHFLRARAALAAAVSVRGSRRASAIAPGSGPPRRPSTGGANACPVPQRTLDLSAAPWPQLTAIRRRPSRASQRPSPASKQSTCGSVPQRRAAAWVNSWAVHAAKKRSIVPIVG